MRVVNFSDETIRSDRFPYPLDNKIEPTFFNAGNTVVNIQGIAISPGSSFQAGIQGAITKGNVEITFEDEAIDTSTDAIKKVVCFYGSLVTENHDDINTSCQ